jgi:ABC-2 type transport system permease protein
MNEHAEHQDLHRTSFDVNPMLQVARNEFYILMEQPLTLIIALVILVIAVIHGAGNSIILPQAAGLFTPGGVLITMGMTNSYFYTTMFTSFLALCVGIMSISGERSSGSIQVLLTKPLYRRDVVAGKFIGGSLFMTVTVIATLIVCVASMLITYRDTLPYLELFVRTCLYGVILSIYCSITLGIAMLIGSFFKEHSAALIASFCYLYFALIQTAYFEDLGSLSKIDPYLLYTFAFSPVGKTVFDMSGSIMSWIGSSTPYIALLLLEVVIVFLLNCLVFNNEEA